MAYALFLPTLPTRYAKGEPVSFKLTSFVSDYDCDYLIRRKGYDAEIVRIYEDQEPSFIVEDDENDEREIIYYVMIPVYNEENNYEPYHTFRLSADYEIIGKAE